jgi:hypothetical protein
MRAILFGGQKTFVTYSLCCRLEGIILGSILSPIPQNYSLLLFRPVSSLSAYISKSGTRVTLILEIESMNFLIKVDYLH